MELFSQGHTSPTCLGGCVPLHPGAPCPSTPAQLADVHCPRPDQPYAMAPRRSLSSPGALAASLLSSREVVTPQSPVPTPAPPPGFVNLLRCLHPCSWCPVAEGVGTAATQSLEVSRSLGEPPGQGRTHREACLSREPGLPALLIRDRMLLCTPVSAGFSMFFLRGGSVLVEG